MDSLGVYPPVLALLCLLWLTPRMAIAAVQTVDLAEFEIKNYLVARIWSQ